MRDKLLQLQQQLNKGLVQREETIKAALLSLLAGENILLIGPPGTGKSMVSRRMSQALHAQDNSYFEYLLTKFSTPEEIFGPLSITALKQDQFKRNTNAYLPTVHIAFLDEIFKASSSILNALLTILNERKFHNGTTVEDIPLLSLVAASNELPTGQEELAALYDRFLVRRFVGYLEQGSLTQLFDLAAFEQVDAALQLSPDEIMQVRANAAQVVFPKEIKQVLLEIWAAHQEQFKENADEQLSDRRFVKIMNLLRISAVTNGRDAVDLSDVFLLKDCLWNNQDNAKTVRELILKAISRYDRMVDVDADQDYYVDVSATDEKMLPAVYEPKSNVIKGYKGSGTQDAPLLIERVEHLLGLERPEVGQKGYYFKQTEDIDCSYIKQPLKNTMNINYDGNGYELKHDTDLVLFELLDNSNFINIITKNIILSKKIKNCSLESCIFNDILCAENFEFSNIENCVFNVCKTYNTSSSRVGLGFVTYDSCVGSEINKCYFVGDFIRGGYYSLSIYMLASLIIENKFTNSVFGYMKLSESETNLYLFSNDDSAGNAFYNIYLDDQYSRAYSKISVSQLVNLLDSNLLNQYFFENTLDWDFENIWQWNAQENRPELRMNGNNVNLKTEAETNSAGNSVKKTGLLQQQLRANIWLAKDAIAKK